SFAENRRQGTHQRYQAWSYLPHAGFQNTKSPLSEDKALNIYSYIDWGFPSYAGSTAGAQIYVNGIKSYNGKVYVSLTADMGMWTRSAVVCINSSAVPEIRIVDADRNTVNLRYNQISQNGFNREVGYTVKLYQPSVYDTEIPYPARVFNAPSTDLTEGLIKVNNMQNFQNNGHSQMITSSLPVFVQLSYDLDQTASNVKRYYLPIYPETCGTLDIDAYNREVGTVLFPLTAGDGTNVNKRLYADLSNWNQVEWYCVLPGNTEIFGEPVCSGDTVTLIGYEKDEFGKIQQNRLFSVVPKISDGGKVREDSVKVSALPLDMSVRDGLRTSFGVNKLSVASQNQVSVLENSKTLVIDNNSLVELDGSGNLAWRLNKVEYNDGGDNDFDFTLENPVRARYVFDNNHIAVADAGTKTIFVMDKNGKLKSQTVGLDNGQWWMFNSFTDPFGLLRSGGSTDLGFMSDFVFWTETKGNTTLNHFLVADTTNKRVLDLVIETDENGDIAGNEFYDGNVLPYLNWVSYDIIPGNKNNFVSVDITEKLKDADGNEMRAVVCGIANYNASDRNGVKRAKGGSVVIYDYRMDTENFADTDEDAYLKRFGRIYDSIGKNGDNIFGNNTDSAVPSFSGVKKVIIANFDGRNFDPNDIQEYSDLELVVCDDMGVCSYTIENKNKANGVTYYYWDYNINKLIPADYFGLNDPLYDVNIVAFRNDLVPGRFRPFSSNYYNRVNNGDTALRTSYAPLKVPIVPMDAKVLPNGNILVLNGYSGKVTYNYKNPYDNLVYDIEADYRGEAIEFTFGTERGLDYPEIVWTSNQLKSYCIDDYVTVGNYTEEELSNWNRILDNLDGKVYSPDNSPINYDNNIIGGFSYMNKPLRVPKSLDR
ncbi:MAG: hypothetical protein KBT47_03995, partial [Armatimonadetes bacterium]|nr:hypothetical protein [Candidatus Hippobium faecium]